MSKAPELLDAEGFVIVRVPRDVCVCSNCSIAGTCLAFDNSKNREPEIFLCRTCISLIYDGLIKVEVYREKLRQRQKALPHGS